MSRLDEILALPKITHNLVQGSPEWQAFRMEHDGASEAAAMLGLSKKVKRNDLLHAKHTGLPREFSDWLQRNVLDHGHAVEARARPLVEAIIGDELYAVTCSRGRISASCDGLTMDDRKAMEHKQWAEDLAALVGAGVLPDEHWPQCQQVLLVTGAEELYFVVSDGTPERMVYIVVRPEREKWEQLVAGWDQFNADRAAYVPAEIKEMPKAEVTLSLPALFIHAKGEITTSNMKEYGEALAKRLADVRSIALVTDQDFSNAKESAKLLRENIQQAKLAKEAMLAQTVTVGEAARMIDTWCEDMRLTALKLEQDVEREDRIKKAAMIAKAKGDYEAHIEALKADTGGPWIVLPAPDWAGAIKNKRNFASMQDALDTALANGKIAADESARKIRGALAALDEEAKGYEHLFADRLSFISKPADDVRALVRARIAEHRAVEQRRAAELAERERARIRQEEQERAGAAAAEESQMRMSEISGIQQQVIIATCGRAGVRKGGTIECIRETLAETEAWPIEESNFGPLTSVAQGAKDKAVADIRALLAKAEAHQAAPTVAPAQPTAAAQIASPAVSSQAAAGNVRPLQRHTPAPAAPPSLRLGQINERIAPLSLTADGLRTLGFEPAGRERAAVLYHEADFLPIVRAAIAHLEDVADQRAAA